MIKVLAYLVKSSFRPNPNIKIRFDYIIMILGIIISVSIVSAASNLFEGYQKTLKRILLDTTAHIIIYSKYEKTIPLAVATLITKSLVNDPSFDKVYPVYSNAAVINNRSISKNIIIKAYNINEFRNLWFDNYVIKGNSELSANNIIIGNVLANELKVSYADSVNLLSIAENLLTISGKNLNSSNYIISGVIKTGYYELDRSLVIMSSNNAFSFFNIEPQYSYIDIYLSHKMIESAPTIAESFNLKHNNKYMALTWADINGNLFSLVKFEKWLIFVIFSFLIIIAAINCISVVTISIYDRKKEIVTLEILGISKRNIERIFFSRIFIICFVSILIGILLGSAFSILISNQDIYTLKPDVYFIDQITTSLSMSNFFAVFIVATILIILSIKLPMSHIKKMSIIEILRGK